MPPGQGGKRRFLVRGTPAYDGNPHRGLEEGRVSTFFYFKCKKERKCRKGGLKFLSILLKLWPTGGSGRPICLYGNFKEGGGVRLFGGKEKKLDAFGASRVFGS